MRKTLLFSLLLGAVAAPSALAPHLHAQETRNEEQRSSEPQERRRSESQERRERDKQEEAERAAEARAEAEQQALDARRHAEEQRARAEAAQAAAREQVARMQAEFAELQRIHERTQQRLEQLQRERAAEGPRGGSAPRREGEDRNEQQPEQRTEPTNNALRADLRMLEERLETLRVKFAEASQKLGQSHPEVVQLRQAIEVHEQILSQFPPGGIREEGADRPRDVAPRSDREGGTQSDRGRPVPGPDQAELRERMSQAMGRVREEHQREVTELRAALEHANAQLRERQQHIEERERELEQNARTLEEAHHELNQAREELHRREEELRRQAEELERSAAERHHAPEQDSVHSDQLHRIMREVEQTFQQIQEQLKDRFAGQDERIEKLERAIKELHQKLEAQQPQGANPIQWSPNMPAPNYFAPMPHGNPGQPNMFHYRFEHQIPPVEGSGNWWWRRFEPPTVIVHGDHQGSRGEAHRGGPAQSRPGQPLPGQSRPAQMQFHQAPGHAPRQVPNHEPGHGPSVGPEIRRDAPAGQPAPQRQRIRMQAPARHEAPATLELRRDGELKSAPKGAVILRLEQAAAGHEEAGNHDAAEILRRVAAELQAADQASDPDQARTRLVNLGQELASHRELIETAIGTETLLSLANAD